jgi:hypothetical protein
MSFWSNEVFYLNSGQNLKRYENAMVIIIIIIISSIERMIFWNGRRKGGEGGGVFFCINKAWHIVMC